MSEDNETVAVIESVGEETAILDENLQNGQNGHVGIKDEEEVQEKTVKNENNNVAITKKVVKSTNLDNDSIKAAYEDVRADNTDTQWAVFKFEDAKISCTSKGATFDEFKQQFKPNERAFGYIRIQTGDEMSKRQKFVFITWIGPEVSVINRAKMSTDKAVIKNLISNFAVELQLENDNEIELKHFVQELIRAGGANYGTGIRD